MTKYELFDLLGLDPTNAQHVQGVTEAAMAILRARHSTGGNLPPAAPNGGSGPIEIEIDPELNMPTPRKQPQGQQPPLEIEDPDNVLDQIKNKPKQPSKDGSASNGNSEDSEESEDSLGSNSPEDFDDNEDSSSQKKSNDSDDAQNNKEKASKETSSSSEKASEESPEEIESDEEDFDEGDEDEISDDTSEDSEDTYSEDDDDSFEDDIEDDEDSFEDDIDADDIEDEDIDEDNIDEDDIDAEEEKDTNNETKDVDDEFTEDEEDSEEDNKSYIDPDEAKNLFGGNGGGGGDSKKANPMTRRLKRARVLKAAKELLEKAKANGASSAHIAKLEAAIKQLEVLEEALHIDDISEQEFNRRVNEVIAAMDAIDAAELSKTTDTERNQRAARIKADMEKPETVDELTAEEEEAIRKERREMRAQEQEKIKNQAAIADQTHGRAASSFSGFEAFVQTLYKAIARQIKNIETKPQTWAALPKRTPGPGVLKKGVQRKMTPDGRIPVLRFYFDCSGSWGDNHIQKGIEALEMLRDFEKQGKLIIIERYFSDHIFEDRVEARAEGGTGAWTQIVDEVRKSGTDNVVIMTDSDMAWDATTGPSYMVPGFVWYLWKNGTNSQELPQHLFGRNATYQFSFNAGA